MLRTLILIICLPASCIAANFTGDPEIVAAAEKARTESSVYWTGSDLPEWTHPCPISWMPGGNVSYTHFQFGDGEVYGWEMVLTEPRGQMLRNVVPHEVDHAVRASIVRRKIPRWLDEGCATLPESNKAKASYRSALIHGNLQSSAWNMLDRKEYPTTTDEMTAFYSGSISIVEWLSESHTPADLLHLQKIGLSTDRQWAEQFGESKQASRKKYEKWFAAKYLSDSPSGKPFIDVWIAGDFACPPCHSFMEYATSTTPESRGFEYHVYRLSREDCAKQGLSVPMFSVGETVYKGQIGDWKEIDKWGAEQLGLNTESAPLPIAEDLPPSPMVPEPLEPPVEFMPGVHASPEALAILTQAMSRPVESAISDPEVTWDGVVIVLAVSDDIPSVTEVAKGPVRRALKRLTKGKASLSIISEGSNHTQFGKYEKELGLDIEMFHIAVLIPATATSMPVAFAIEEIEVLVHNITKNYTQETPRDIPVEPITEDVSPEDYDLVKELILDTEEIDDKVWTPGTNEIYGLVASIIIAGAILIRKKKKAKPVVLEDFVIDQYGQRVHQPQPLKGGWNSPAKNSPPSAPPAPPKKDE